MKKILFITPYPHDTAPSQRFRFEQYFGFLKEAGYEFKQVSFLNESTWNILYKPGHHIQKIFGILLGFFKRNFLLIQSLQYDFIFIHREATPIGPPILESLLANVLGKKIIYDFDDAIWLPNTSENNTIIAGIKWHHKVSYISSWSYKVSCGNAFLRDYAKKAGGKNVQIIPTTIDMVGMHNQTKDYTKENKKVVFGWTGTHSTMHYLDKLVPVFQELESKYPNHFILRIISNKEPQYDLASMDYIAWNKKSEIFDLLSFDLGLMPLEDNLWAKGKCGFKALQYMSLGIPAVVSPVGVNTTIVQHQVNGFVAEELKDWSEVLEQVINGSLKLDQLGKIAQDSIRANYSVQSQKENFLTLFS